MPDRDTVKKALEICSGRTFCRGDCPYDGKPDCYNQMGRDALALIKELEEEAQTDRRAYRVRRRMTASGKQEIIQVYGIEAAKAAVRGCWDYVVTDVASGALVM